MTSWLSTARAGTTAAGGSSSSKADIHQLAIGNKLEELKEALKTEGPDLDARKGTYGLTALHEACRYDRWAICVELLKYGAEFNETTTEGQYTALHLAAFDHHYRCVETLLFYSKKRLDLSMKNADGKTALQMAQEKNYRDIVRIIVCGEIYQLAREKHKIDHVHSLLIKLQTEYRIIDGCCTPETEQVVHKLIDQALLDATSVNNLQVVGFLLQFGIRNGDVMVQARKMARNAHHYDVAAILILSYRAFEPDNMQVRYLLAPEVEVEHNNFLVRGSKQERDLVFRSHTNRSINSSIAMRVALQRGFLDTAGLILRYTDCDLVTGKVDWHGLGLQLLPDAWIVSDARIYRTVGSSVHDSVSPQGDWVTALNLSRNYLAQVPSVICRLKNLQELDLSENPIGRRPQASPVHNPDSPPAEEPCLPAALFGLQSIKRLTLCRMQLVNFPPVADWSRSLNDLNLAGNRLRTLPPSFGQAIDLLSLNLSDNQLASVPCCLGYLTNLNSLNLGGNSAVKTLPLELGRLSHLVALDTRKMTLANIPDWVGSRAGEVVHYLNKQLRKLEPQRVAKLIVVGNNRKLRRLLVEQLHETSGCPTGIFDLGSLETFFLFSRVVEPRHCHFVLVWDVDGGESLDDLLAFFMFLRKKVKLPEKSKSDRTKHGPHPQFQVVLAAVQEEDVPEAEGQVRINAILTTFHFPPDLFPIRPLARIVNLSAEHRERSVLNLLRTLETLNNEYLVIAEVPHCHVTVRSRLSLTKSKLSEALDKKPWMVKKCDILLKMNSLMKDKSNEILDTNVEELNSLLLFLQHDGNVLRVRHPGSAFDEIFFFTPQWLFRSLQDAFGPTAILPSRFATRVPGVYQLDVVLCSKMFGPGSCRHRLAEFALPLATYFGMAYPISRELIFLPFQLPEKPSVRDSYRLFNAVSRGENLVRFMSSGEVSGVQHTPWPNGFFPLLQSYTMDSVAELMQEDGVREPVSFAEAQGWMGPGGDGAATASDGHATAGGASQKSSLQYGMGVGGQSAYGDGAVGIVTASAAPKAAEKDKMQYGMGVGGTSGVGADSMSIKAAQEAPKAKAEGLGQVDKKV